VAFVSLSIRHCGSNRHVSSVQVCKHGSSLGRSRLFPGSAVWGKDIQCSLLREVLRRRVVLPIALVYGTSRVETNRTDLKPSPSSSWPWSTTRAGHTLGDDTITVGRCVP